MRSDHICAMAGTIFFDFPTDEAQKQCLQYLKQSGMFLYMFSPVSPAFEERETNYLKKLEARAGSTFEILSNVNSSSTIISGFLN